MRSYKNGLDEMQKERRNHIGNQMFILMFYAFLLDAGLYGFGVRWLAYPANAMIILMVCMGAYLIRTIAANAYVPPGTQRRKPGLSLILAAVFAAALAAYAVFFFVNSSVQPPADAANGYSALILFIVSAVGLLISLAVLAIKKAGDKDDGEE
jgi:Flp pilus assembly protein TadB